MITQTDTDKKPSCLGWIEQVADPSSPLPLEHTRVSVRVTGPLAVVSVTQYFTNPLEEPAELGYLFPLPDKAAVVDFELHIGDRTIRGDLQEIEKARQTYEDARQQGHQTGLLEQRASDLLAVQIANVRPGEAIRSVMRYQDTLGYRDGEYEFVFPMGITPKYHSLEHPQEGDGQDAPVARPGERIGPVKIEVSFDAGAPASEPNSPSHILNVTRLDEQRFTIRLREETIPDHDFVLRCPAALKSPVLGMWRSHGEGGDYFLAALLPPAQDAVEPDPRPREFIFVLDRSGSMRGEPIAQARNALRACLRSLNPADTFRILLFDHETAWNSEASQAITQTALDQADAFLDAVDGRGGTEIVGALKAALAAPGDPERSRLIIFLTDGAVSAQQRALKQVRQHIGAARLFTFGIGPSVNRPLLRKLAEFGRGTCEFLQLDEDIEGAILRFQDRVAFPVLSDFQLRWKGGKTWDVCPEPLPDLYLGQPLQIAGRISGGGRTLPALTVTARHGGQDIEFAAVLPQAAEDPAVARAWARTRLESLLDRQALEGDKAHKTRDAIIALALEHNLVTPHTAFVAVDESVIASDGKPQRIQVSHPLPQGLMLEGFMGGPPLAASGSPFPGLMRSGAAAPASHNMKASFSLSEQADPMFDMAQAAAGRVAGQSMNRLKNAQSDSERPAGEELLRQLARTQQVDGSWEGDVEHTAAALLLFVNRSHTTHSGHYRRQVMKASSWLKQATGDGFAEKARRASLAALKAALSGDSAPALDDLRSGGRENLADLWEAVLEAR